jgi:hypothetical protein
MVKSNQDHTSQTNIQAWYAAAQIGMVNWRWLGAIYAIGRILAEETLALLGTKASVGASGFGPWERIWKSWAPGKCKFFLWTAALNLCWTADRLARKGLPHPAACPFCDQVEETVDHLLVACVFSWQFWFNVLQQFNLQILAPQTDPSFFDWWAAASSRVDGQVQKGLNSIIILAAWSIWKHRNRCVFDGATPDVSYVVSDCKEELHQWSLARARGVPYLLAQEHRVG